MDNCSDTNIANPYIQIQVTSDRRITPPPNPEILGLPKLLPSTFRTVAVLSFGCQVTQCPPVVKGDLIYCNRGCIRFNLYFGIKK
jgi:hypothetical protein